MLQKKKREEQNSRVDSLLDTMNNSKEFWGEIRKYRHRTLISNDISQEGWVDHFDKVFNENTTAQTENEEIYVNPGNDEESYDEILDTDIRELEVKKAIQRLKSGKAAGVDWVIAEILKAAEQEITPFLTKYFSVLFSSSQFLSEWAKAIIIPLYKKGDVNNPDNCREISLLSVVSKVYTHIINSRLTLWAESNFVLTYAQAGGF